MTQAKDPLHGVTLEAILVQLHARFGWDGLAERVDVRCFSNEPSIKSSLKFLRRTPWARKEVEDLYIDMVSHPAPASDNPWLRGRDG